MPNRINFLKSVDKQYAAQIVVVILFLLACVWIAVQPNPFDANAAPPPHPNQEIPPPNPEQMAAHATAYQLEIDNNIDQTTGIVFGGIILVGLVAAGTLLTFFKR